MSLSIHYTAYHYTVCERTRLTRLQIPMLLMRTRCHDSGDGQPATERGMQTSAENYSRVGGHALPTQYGPDRIGISAPDRPSLGEPALQIGWQKNPANLASQGPQRDSPYGRGTYYDNTEYIHGSSLRPVCLTPGTDGNAEDARHGHLSDIWNLFTHNTIPPCCHYSFTSGPIHTEHTPRTRLILLDDFT